MELDTFKPTFLIQIEGQTLSKDITQEITSLTFEDNEEELDVLELSITDRNLQREITGQRAPSSIFSPASRGGGD